MKSKDIDDKKIKKIIFEYKALDQHYVRNFGPKRVVYMQTDGQLLAKHAPLY